MKLPFENAGALAAALGRRVRALREAAGLTQEKLAYESGLHSKGTLSKIESGQQLATVAVLDLLARRLGVELLDLFVQPDEGLVRHALVDRSRALPESALRETLARWSHDAAASQRSQPFVEVDAPERESDVPTVIPLLGLDVAAGAFDGRIASHSVRWVRPTTPRRLHRGCFVVRVVGRSMEPTIADGAWAIFTRRLSSDPRGRVVIAQCNGLVDADTATTYTVKRFRGTRVTEGSSHWRDVRLEPDNRAFSPIELDDRALVDFSIVAELVEVLGAVP